MTFNAQGCIVKPVEICPASIVRQFWLPSVWRRFALFCFMGYKDTFVVACGCFLLSISDVALSVNNKHLNIGAGVMFVLKKFCFEWQTSYPAALYRLSPMPREDVDSKTVPPLRRVHRTHGRQPVATSCSIRTAGGRGE